MSTPYSSAKLTYAQVKPAGSESVKSTPASMSDAAQRWLQQNRPPVKIFVT
jgi:hypothetical protein